MKIEVNKIANNFVLTIDGEQIMKSDRLSGIVSKIEKYLKLRFLPESDDDTPLGRIGGFFKQ